MQKDHIEVLRAKRQDYHKNIKSALEHYAYRGDRYDIDFSVAIGLSDNDIDLRPFSSYTRKSDAFLILEKNLCCVVLDCTPAGGGMKAAENMLVGFQQRFFGRSLYSSVVWYREYRDVNKMVHHLFDILEYSISNNMDNMVVDPTQVIDY